LKEDVVPKNYVSVGIAVVFFAVGVIVGIIIKGGSGGTCDTPHDQALNVSSTGRVDCEEAKIKMGNTVSWQAPSGTSLRIEFEDPSVFPALRVTGSFGTSGRPNSNAGTSVPYPYNASVYGKQTPTPGPTAPRLTPNARIIIMP
jgi:hypothetical protein